MYFAKFDKQGRVVEAHNDSTSTICPDGCHEISVEQFANRFDLLLLNGVIVSSPILLITPVVSIDQSINKYVLSKISAMPFDYESVAEVYAWRNDSDYGAEAQSLHAWCIECQKIAFKVKSNELVFSLVDEAIAALPVFITL